MADDAQKSNKAVDQVLKVLKVGSMNLDNTTLRTIQGMSHMTSRNALQLPRVRYPNLNPFPLSYNQPELRTMEAKVRLPGIRGQVRASAEPQDSASAPFLPSATGASWQEWEDKALEWTKLAAAFRSSTDQAIMSELASAAEAESASTLAAVRRTVEKTLEAKSALTADQAKEESEAHARGNYGTRTGALGRAYSAETLWFSVFRAWAFAKTAEGSERMKAIAAALQTTASATQTTQKLAAFEPEASSQTSAKWRATAQEWEAAAAELTRPELASVAALTSRTSSEVSIATSALISVFAIGGVILAALRIRKRKGTMVMEPLLTNVLD